VSVRSQYHTVSYTCLYRQRGGGGGFENDEQCALMGEIFRMYCNESADSTGLYCDGNCMTEYDVQRY
jgi:hypothetical protein